jgi:hypothetical protein
MMQIYCLYFIDEGTLPTADGGPELLDQILSNQMPRQWPPSTLTESNLRRMIKLFPFGKMRREAILRKLQLRFNQVRRASF